MSCSSPNNASPRPADVATADLPSDTNAAGPDNKTRAEKFAERDMTLSQESWRSFVGEGEGAVLMDTFYGQFKSCVSTVAARILRCASAAVAYQFTILIYSDQ